MERRILLPRMNPELVADQIGDFIINQIVPISYTGGVIGFSGGVDSTATGALAKRAFDKYNVAHRDKLELVGYLLPSNTNDPSDTKDGRYVAEKLGVRYELVDIEPVVRSFSSTNPDSFRAKYHKGNMMSEIRAVILHQKSATERKLLLGTGNKDEDFGVGYYTLFGDGAVHLSPIGALSKRLVREMAQYLGFPEAAKRVAAPGLEPGQTAFKDLGYSYDMVELVGCGLEQKFTLEDLLTNSQVQERAERDMKEYGRLYGISKFLKVEEIVGDILRRNKIAAAKSEIVHPPVAAVTLEYV